MPHCSAASPDGTATRTAKVRVTGSTDGAISRTRRRIELLRVRPQATPDPARRLQFGDAVLRHAIATSRSASSRELHHRLARRTTCPASTLTAVITPSPVATSVAYADWFCATASCAFACSWRASVASRALRFWSSALSADEFLREQVPVTVELGLRVLPLGLGGGNARLGALRLQRDVGRVQARQHLAPASRARRRRRCGSSPCRRRERRGRLRAAASLRRRRRRPGVAPPV